MLVWALLTSSLRCGSRVLHVRLTCVEFVPACMMCGLAGLAKPVLVAAMDILAACKGSAKGGELEVPSLQ